MDSKSIRLRTYDDDYHTAYLELADHPHELIAGIVGRTVRLQEIIRDYDGPSMSVEFNQQGRVIGIEILYPYEDDNDETE